MDDAYIGEIRMFAGTFAPVKWAFCNGESLPISVNRALFNVIGTRFGGDGVNYFNVPNLVSRLPMGHGAGKGLTVRDFAASGGANSYVLDSESTPSHSHILNGAINIPTTTSPENAFLASNTPRTTNRYKSVGDPAPPLVQLPPHSIKSVGLHVPVSNIQPSLSVCFIICTEGIYPPKP
jgi:microcystin-dependent protein